MSALIRECPTSLVVDLGPSPAAHAWTAALAARMDRLAAAHARARDDDSYGGARALADEAAALEAAVDEARWMVARLGAGAGGAGAGGGGDTGDAERRRSEGATVPWLADDGEGSRRSSVA